MTRKEIVVQKYGGTSVASIEHIKIVASHIREVSKSNKVIVVVSAMGDETDRLKKLAREISGSSPSPSELDKLLVTGEEQSASLLALCLEAQGKKAVSLTGMQIRLETDPVHGRGKIRGIRNIERIQKLLDQNTVVVVAGFQGVAGKSDEMVTLGPGGSDLTAIALAAALNTPYCEIYTDVDGIYAIDPRLVREAKKFKDITYSQMLQLSSAGAGVLMDRCVLLAQNLGVSIRVLLSPSIGKSSGGTIVHSGSTLENMEGSLGAQAGIAVQREMALIKIYNIPNLPGMAKKIFGALENLNLIDVVQGHGEKKATISVLISPEDISHALSGLKRIKEINIAPSQHVVGLTLVDPEIKEGSGYVYRVSKALSRIRINIEMLSSSGITILVVVKKKHLSKAAQALGREFELVED